MWWALFVYVSLKLSGLNKGERNQESLQLRADCSAPLTQKSHLFGISHYNTNFQKRRAI